MASMWRKAMLYLGLGPDEEYDDFDVTGEHQRAVQPRPVVRRTTGDVQHDPEPSGSVRTLSPSDDHDDGRETGRNGHDHSSDHRHENGRSPAARTTDRGVDPSHRSADPACARRDTGRHRRDTAAPGEAGAASG